MINLSTCFCEYQRQIIKHIIVSCLKHDRTKIKKERKSINYRVFINTETELKKKFKQWVMKLRLLSQFRLIYKHLYQVNDC